MIDFRSHALKVHITADSAAHASDTRYVPETYLGICKHAAAVAISIDVVQPPAAGQCAILGKYLLALKHEYTRVPTV